MKPLRPLPLLLLLAALASLTSCKTTQTGYVAVSGGGSLYYEERGKGEPVVFLHGHSLDTRMWDEQFRAFARHHRAVRLDFRGYGRSSEQSETFQFTHVDDLLTLLDSLHIDRAHIVGLSMGSFIAGDLLAMYPERALTVTMASGGIRNWPGPSTPMDSAEMARRDVEIAALKAKGVDVYKREWLEALMGSGGSQRERMRQPLWQMISDWSAWQPLHKEVRLYYGKEAWQALRSRGTTDVPTLFVRGENELKGKRGKPAEMEYLKEAAYEVVPDCGHMLNMERPAEFNRLVMQFIDSH